MYSQNLISVIKANRYYYVSFAILWLIGLYHQLTSSQFALSIWVNNWNTPILDTTMIWFTYAGEGLLLVAAGFVLVLLDRKSWLMIILCLSIPSVITQFFKQLIFEDHHRPVILMTQITDLHFVKGVVMNQFNSFPSGHTTAAFSLYTLLALLIQHKKSGSTWVFMGTLVALSRVYLLQHFWVDIIAGSMIGTITCTLLFVWLKPKNTTDAIQK